MIAIKSKSSFDCLFPAVSAGTCPIDWTPSYYGTCLKHFDHLGAALATFRNKLQIIYFKGFLADVGRMK